MIGNLRRLMGHKVVLNAAFMYIVQLTSYLFPVITLPYLTRVLSTDTFGLVAYSQILIWYFLTLTEYGFNLTATRAIASASSSREKLNLLFSEVMVAKFVLTLMGYVIFCILILAIPTLREHIALYQISFLTVVANLLFPLWLFQGLEKMRMVAFRDLGAKALALATLVLLVHGDKDYLWAAAAQSGGMLLSALFGFWSIRQLGVKFQMPTWIGVTAQLRTGWPAFLSLAILAFSSITNMFLLGLWAPVREIAYYSGAQRIISAARSLASPVATAVYPHAIKKSMNSEEEVLLFVRKYQWMFIGPFLVGGLVLMVSAPWSIPLFLGQKYVSSIHVLQILALNPMLLSMQLVYSTYYMLACGYDKVWMRFILIAVGVNFTVFFAAMPFLPGSIALAMATMAGDGTGALLQLNFFLRKLRDNTRSRMPEPEVCLSPNPPH